MTPCALVSEARDAAGVGRERFCVMAGISSLQKMTGEDAAQLAGQRHERNPGVPGCRRGTATGMVGFHGGRIAVERPRVRDKAAGSDADADERLDPQVRACGAVAGACRSGRRRLGTVEVCGVKALAEARFMEWMSSDLSGLDLPAIRIHGLHMGDDLPMIGARRR